MSSRHRTAPRAQNQRGKDRRGPTARRGMAGKEVNGNVLKPDKPSQAEAARVASQRRQKTQELQTMRNSYAGDDRPGTETNKRHGQGPRHHGQSSDGEPVDVRGRSNDRSTMEVAEPRRLRSHSYPTLLIPSKEGPCWTRSMEQEHARELRLSARADRETHFDPSMVRILRQAVE